MKPKYCSKCGEKTCLDGTNIHFCVPVTKEIITMSKETWQNNIENWVDCAIDAGYEIPETAQKALESIISQSIQEAVLEEQRRLVEKIKTCGDYELRTEAIIALISKGK